MTTHNESLAQKRNGTLNSEHTAGAFLGRDAEMQELLAALKEVLAGQGRVFLIGGEPGIGKSRLADEFAFRAKERGARVLWGRCWEAGGAPAYWPWVQSLRSYIRDSQTETLRLQLGTGASEIAQILPEIRELFPDLATPSASDPEGARFRLFEATSIFLTSASRVQPLVLILDDLHEADVPSLLLLRFLAADLSDARILILGTYRDTEPTRDHPLSSTLAALSRQPVTRHLLLGGLSEPDVARFIELTTDLTPAPTLVAAVHRETEGNPLFVSELVRLLAHEGRLQRAAEEPLFRLPITRGIREVIGRRLGHLSQECHRVLTLAAVLGREFRLDALQRVTDLSADQLLRVLDEAAAARVVSEVPGALGQLRFSHVLIRDTLYDEIPLTRRVRVHRQIGESLETVYAHGLEPHLAELAYHFFEAAPAGDADKAIQCARAAGERALRLLAYEEAVRLYHMALQANEMKEPADQALRCDLLLALADAQMRAGDTPSAKETFREAANIARTLNLPEYLARAALGYGGRFVWEAGRGDPYLLPLLEEALRSLPEEDSLLQVRVMARLAGGPLRNMRDREPRAKLSQEAVKMARRLGDPATLAYALDGCYAAVWWPENLEERLSLVTEMARVAADTGDKERALQGHHFRCLALLELGDLRGVYGELEAKAQIAGELRQPSQLWYLAVVRAALALFEGRYAEAEELIPQALRLGERAQSWNAGVSYKLQMYALRREQGRLAELEATVRRAVDEYPTYPVWRCVLAHLYGELSRETDARITFDHLAATDFAILPMDEEWLFGMSLLAEVAEFLGDSPRAGRLYELLLPYHGRNAVSAPDVATGSVSRSLGILASTLARWQEAEEHFQYALEMNTRMGARPWVAHTQYDYARMLLARDARSDRDEAVQLLSQALETSQALGMSALSEKISELGDSLGLEAIRVDKREAPSTRVGRAFMFTDIVNSTTLVEAIGDEAWEVLLSWHDRTLRALITAHGGEEIDHTGDGFFVAFMDAEAAIACSIAIQRTLADHRRQHGFAPQVRIGLHSSVATRRGLDYTGKGVHEAERIADLAQGEEILASLETLDSAPSSLKASEPRSVSLKGISEPIQIVRIEWH